MLPLKEPEEGESCRDYYHTQIIKPGKIVYYISVDDEKRPEYKNDLKNYEEETIQKTDYFMNILHTGILFNE